MTELPRRTPGAPRIPHYRTTAASAALLIRVAAGLDEWARRDADEGVPAPALYARFSSRGEAVYADKVLSAMRKGFGGHNELPAK